jgi:hypothetical protein
LVEKISLEFKGTYNGIKMKEAEETESLNFLSKQIGN